MAARSRVTIDERDGRSAVARWLPAAVAGLALLAGVSTPASQAPVFRAETDLVVLHVSVRDARGRPVTGLPDSAFGVIDDGRAQPLQFVLTAGTPATVGLVIDDSVSLLPHRDIVLAAAGAFADASHPDDEFFALAFNERVRAALPEAAPFTSDRAVLRHALDAVIRTRGRTALFDAIVAGLDYAERGTRARRVLVVLSDGRDNASRATLDEAVLRAQSANTVVYTIALRDTATRDADSGVLRDIARATGGVTHVVRGPEAVATALAAIASDLRHAYTLGFVPQGPHDGAFRRVRVVVDAPGHGRLQVRARSGYRAGGA